jgi:hypothetical protein
MKKINVNISPLGLLTGAAIVGSAIVIYKTVKVGGDIKDNVTQTITEDLNPVSDKNIIYESLNSLFFQNENTLGGWLYDITH